MMNNTLLNQVCKKLSVALASGIKVTFLTLLLSGCSSVDVLTQTQNGAAYEYELGQLDTIDVVDMAQEHCGKYGKNAELTNRYSDANRIFNTLIFNCS
ncbi:MAG: hypothetical protein QNK26_09010 [Moritella sp.]|uniref:hypothetical protein n=1 Tax=Moritella sp. TaxID=78556 RepID=UPI0029BCDD50|nr:hypothetical protein [Moritella sp.]MDX2320718.1 hypothetical protein [Moritella sp.]